MVIAGAMFCISVVALAAIFPPARRATSLDP